MDFAAEYSRLIIEEAKAKGITGAALDKQIAEMKAFAESYKNQLYRMPITFTEIFRWAFWCRWCPRDCCANSRFMQLEGA